MIETQGTKVPVAEVRTAHRQFVEAVAGLTPTELTAPSTLPGWTRAHVIAHVADGGHAFANLTEFALRGELTALFPGGVTERNERIEKLATSPDLMTHLETGITRLEAAWSSATPTDWTRPVRFRNGDLAGTVYTRWREVWIHLVDCETGITPAAWPSDLAAHAIDFLQSRLPTGVVLLATDTGQQWTTPPNPTPPTAGTRTVSGEVRDVAAWLAGREPVGPLTGPNVELGEWPPHPTPNR